MPAKRRETQTRIRAQSECHHYWIIDTSQQDQSKGRCRLCGEERTFQNKVAFPHKKPDVAIEVDLDVPPPGSAD